MALGIYLSASTTDKLSDANTFENPFSLTFDGRTGGVKQVKLYVRNNDPLYYYENLQIGLTDSGPQPIINQPTDGFVWKLSAGNTQPTKNDWANTAGATVITLPDIGSVGTPDTSTYLPFWVLVQVPPGLDVGTFDTVRFTIGADEVLV